MYESIFKSSPGHSKDFPGGASGKESAFQCMRCKRCGLIPWRRKWQAPPVFLPGEAHGERSLVGYSPWNHRVRHH